MRKKLWRQFHLWTLGLLGLLTVANVASALRPFSSSDKHDLTPGTLRLGRNTQASDRAPASDGKSPGTEGESAHTVLKTIAVGCDELQTVHVAEGLRQLRLQVQMCSETISSVINVTNGFEATLFTASLAQAVPPSEPPPGVMTTTSNEKTAKAVRVPMAATATTDYISLSPGHNEIKIQRRNRTQTLTVSRQ